MLLLAQIPNFVVLLMVAGFFCICLVLILTVLIQKPSGGGLSGAFGSGAGSGQTAFGAKTGDALTIATIFMFCIFVLGAIGLNYVTRPSGASSTVPTATGTPPSGTSPGGAAPPESGNKAPATPPQAEKNGQAPALQSGAPEAPPAQQPEQPASPPEGEQPTAPPSGPPAQPSEPPAQPK